MFRMRREPCDAHGVRSSLALFNFSLGQRGRRLSPTYRRSADPVIANVPRQDISTRDNSMDEFAAQFLNAPGTEEALAWLQGASRSQIRTLGEDESAADSISMVEELYAAGASNVFAVDIDSYDGGANTGKILIELTDDPKDREQVLGIVEQIARANGFDPEPDSGQRYVFVMLD